MQHDVFLICSNAMQYNEPDTIYHKQVKGLHFFICQWNFPVNCWLIFIIGKARVIKELAIKKFHKIRLEVECSGKDVKLYQKMRPVNGDVHFESNYFLNDYLDEGEMQTGISWTLLFYSIWLVSLLHKLLKRHFNVLPLNYMWNELISFLVP